MLWTATVSLDALAEFRLQGGATLLWSIYQRVWIFTQPIPNHFNSLYPLPTDKKFHGCVFACHCWVQGRKKAWPVLPL